MNRFFGMMPSSEVDKEVVFKDSVDMTILVQAGSNGWSIIYADHSAEFGDNKSAADDNYEAALAKLYTHFKKNELTEVAASELDVEG